MKLQQDRKIHNTIQHGAQPKRDDFYFTADWISRQPTPNPVSEQLFRNIQMELEKEIATGQKKRIFSQSELIDLKPSTIIEVVCQLEEYDLHGIDEDPNGRMFETFLNTTVQGKELGQFFTPRSVVRLRVMKRELPRVIDACCGSGGFLIEALAELSHAIAKSRQLTNDDRERLRAALQTDVLYGIEANNEIGRIARLNMYLHGDGRSRIYVNDSLDKELIGEAGLPPERQGQLDELRERLIWSQGTFQCGADKPTI